jgi:hypothetical protein
VPGAGGDDAGDGLREGSRGRKQGSDWILPSSPILRHEAEGDQAKTRPPLGMVLGTN